MHAGDAHLDRAGAAPDFSSCASLVHVGELGLQLHRAFQRPRCGHGMAAQRGQAAEIEFVLLVPVAAHDFPARHRIGARGPREPIDRADERGGRQIEHAFA